MACGEKRQNDGQELVTIDLKGLIQTDGKPVLLEDFAASVTEVPLETTDLSLINYLGMLIYEDGRFYINGDEQFYIFDKEGNFLKGFGHKGEGPEEFNRVEQIIAVPGKILLYDLPKQNILEYDRKGNLLDILKVPFRFRAVTPLKNGEYMGYMSNYSGQERLHFGVFEPGGEVRDSVFYTEQYQAESLIVFYREGQFLKGINDQLLFKEYFNDTIFVVQDKKLQPAYFLDLGDRRTSYGDRFEPVEPGPGVDFFNLLIPVVFVGETKDYLVFNSKGTILYDKKKRIAERVKLMYRDEEFIPKFISEDNTTVIGYYEDEENEDNPVLILVRLEE